MTARATPPPPYFPDLEPLAELLRNAPATAEERLLHIAALGQRVAGYVEFMCGVASLTGTSAEAKDKAVALFQERLATLEAELGQLLRRSRRRTRGAARRPSRSRAGSPGK
jgi:hypothetical protein